MHAHQFRRSGRIVGSLILVVAIAAVATFVIQPYAFTDWMKLRNYSAPAGTVSLADDSTMTDKARHLFYVNHASIESKANFRSKCTDASEKTIIIGCYQSGQRGIYVLQVSDDRLKGIEQVTAAHEMLHAAYERLRGSERKRVDTMLQDYATNHLKDDRIKAILKAYETSEPGQQLNEMHSIFGSEIANLPKDLEAYYAQYFQSRTTVVAYAVHYQEAFTSRQTKIKQYDDQLGQQSARVKANTQSLQSQAAAIEKERQRLDGYRSSGNIETYNDGVEPFNAKIVAYNQLLQQTRSLIVGYNALVAERNAIAAQTVALQQAIDSSDLPQSQK